MEGESMIENNIFSAVNMMISTMRMHKKLLDSSVCKSIGLHRTQHRILMHLANRERLPSQKALAEHINITPAAVTGALKKLEAGGYIERSIGDDNRYNEIKITPLGLNIVNETKAMFSEIDTSLFEGFTDNELVTFIEYHNRIQANINKNMEVEQPDEKMV